jgi:peptidoglycan/xylan/chitin deacetylase (PgdA/CDA1 family)
LAAKGFSIQSHSMQHRFLTRLSPPELRSDLETSRKTIEDNVGLPVTMLAVPMGRINPSVIDAATAAGYTVIMTSHTGINATAGDLRALHRFQIKRTMTTLPLGGYFSSLSPVRIRGAATDLAKKIRDRLR